jgi:hypothetical protein
MTGFNCDVLWKSCVNLTIEDGIMKAETRLVTKETPESEEKWLVLYNGLWKLERKD